MSWSTPQWAGHDGDNGLSFPTPPSTLAYDMKCGMHGHMMAAKHVSNASSPSFGMSQFVACPCTLRLRMLCVDSP
jgi:hypothetical protein